MWMLDTGTCVYILRERPVTVRQRLERIASGEVVISAIVLSELYFGAARKPEFPQWRVDVEDFASRLTVLAWNEAAAIEYGTIRAYLEKKGKAPGSMDMLIAAHARSIGATLVTNNSRHFSMIPDLRLENWI